MKRRRTDRLWEKRSVPKPITTVAKKPKRRKRLLSGRRRKSGKATGTQSGITRTSHTSKDSQRQHGGSVSTAPNARLFSFAGTKWTHWDLAPDNIEIQEKYRAGPYTYKPLDSSRDEIRLLKLPPLQAWDQDQENQVLSDDIETTLIHVSLGESPKYEALSYRWSTENEAAAITVDSHLVRISRTLKSALQALRVSMKNKLVWVDALCINQRDYEERNEQVSKMRNIYSNAEEVTAWLGARTYFTDMAFPLMQDLYDHIDHSLYIENAILDFRKKPNWNGLVEILRSEYWKRIWVIQEVNSARHLTLRCGSQTIDWGHFAAVQNKLSSSANVKTYSFGHELDLWWGIVSGGPRVLSLPSSDHPGLPELSTALIFFNDHLATDPRDIVYALIGLTSARDDHRMQIDYSKSVREVYINVIDYVLRREAKLDIICGKFTWTAIPRLPSWTPDWGSSYLRYVRPLISRPPGVRSFSASRGLLAKATLDVEKGLLCARGVRVTSVSLLGNAISRKNFGGMGSAVLDWYMMSLSHEIEGHDEAFTSTIICDSAADNPLLLKKILGAFPRLALKVVPDRLRLLANALDEPDSWVESWLRLASSCLVGRRFFISEQGLMGLCPENYKDGDIIVILLGCSVPMLLRPFNEGDYELVGDVYLNGYMYGKGIDELNEGKFEIETFDIS